MSTGKRAFTACMFLAFLIPSQTILRAQEEAASAHDLARKGRRLSAEEAQTLEKQLGANSDDLASRTQLLGYYWSKRDREAGYKHVLWIIENRPDAPIAGLPYGALDPYLDKQAYSTAKAAWLKQADKLNEDAQVLGNAAAFFLLHERKLAESFLQKAQSSEPDNPHWAERLGQLYKLEANTQRTVEKKQEAAAKALKHFEDALRATKQEAGRMYLLADVAKMSFDAGETKKAETYATELLSKSSSNERSWNTGNAVHHGNLILGRLALKTGDIEKAKKHLIAAGKTPGSPQLNSFGPNMALAKELLEKSETEIVFEYFELCSKFWNDRRGQIEQWTNEIKNGHVPDFAANLVY